MIYHKRSIAILLIVLFLCSFGIRSVHSQTGLSSEAAQFIIGPQVPIGNTWFDQTQVERAKVHGAQCQDSPPTDLSALNSFVMHHYYDLSLAEYAVYERTKDPQFLTYARKCADVWWKHPEWIKEGTQRDFDNGRGPSPRHAGLGGLILRAIDGRPEMWPWIHAYTRHQFDNWLKRRIGDPQLYYGVREGAFILHGAAWLAKAHPDATVRAQYLADIESVSVNYFGRLQQADGSWRWGTAVDEFVDDDGGTLTGVMQPFMVGLLLAALVDVHRITTNETVKTSIQNQITKACRHLYSDGPYLKQLVPSLNVPLGGFAYFFHGGTSVNPTRYEKGNYPTAWDTTNISDVQNARQATGPIIAAYGYAFKITGNLEYKKMGDELWSYAFGDGDKIRNYFATDGKGYNQNARRAGSYLAWAGQIAAPTVTPTPSTPTTAPSVDGTKATKIIDSQNAVWTIGPKLETLRNGVQVGGGAGSIYKYVSQTVYVLGTDSKWYRWSASSWGQVGAEPGVVQPSPTPAPTPSPSPQPSPSPSPEPTIKPRETVDLPWPSNKTQRSILWKQKGAEGWTCWPYDGVLYCWR